MSAATSSPMPRAVSWSAVLHLMLLATMIVFTWWSQRLDQDPPAQFELVAGPGDNYAARAASTTTAPPDVNLTLPEPEPRPVAPPPPRPEVIASRPEPLKVEKAPEKIPVKIEPAREKVTFDEFRNEHGAPKVPSVRQPRPIRAKTINVDRVMASTDVITRGAGGTALTANEVSLSRRYVALIIQRIRQALEEAGITELREAGIQFSVGVKGAISNAHITQSSGSANFDRAVVSAFRRIRPIGPPPTGRAEVFKTVIRLTES